MLFRVPFQVLATREDAAAGADNDVNGADSVPVPPADFPQDEKEDLPFW